MKYGYLMEHSFIEDQYYLKGPSGFKTPCSPTPVTYVSETKKRIQASPFGFGINWSDLTSQQLAIAAALGITHAPS
jgi:hypothetical protein